MKNLIIPFIRHGKKPGSSLVLHETPSKAFCTLQRDTGLWSDYDHFCRFTGLTRAVAISNFASLLYYAIANYAALRLEIPVFPRVVLVLGLTSCVLLL
jgi:hypothetical protein